jgi:hypothetical protein
MPGLDPGIRQKHAWPGESPAFYCKTDALGFQRKLLQQLATLASID